MQIEFNGKEKTKTEKEITREIKSFLKMKNIFHYKHWGGGFGYKGVADIIGICNGRFLAIEIKTQRGKASVEQLSFLRSVVEAGGIGFVARSVQDVKEFLENGAWI